MHANKCQQTILESNKQTVHYDNTQLRLIVLPLFYIGWKNKIVILIECNETSSLFSVLALFFFILFWMENEKFISSFWFEFTIFKNSHENRLINQKSFYTVMVTIWSELFHIVSKAIVLRWSIVHTICSFLFNLRLLSWLWIRVFLFCWSFIGHLKWMQSCTKLRWTFW